MAMTIGRGFHVFPEGWSRARLALGTTAIGIGAGGCNGGSSFSLVAATLATVGLSGLAWHVYQVRTADWIGRINSERSLAVLQKANPRLVEPQRLWQAQASQRLDLSRHGQDVAAEAFDDAAMARDGFVPASHLIPPLGIRTAGGSVVAPGLNLAGRQARIGILVAKKSMRFVEGLMVAAEGWDSYVVQVGAQLIRIPMRRDDGLLNECFVQTLPNVTREAFVERFGTVSVIQSDLRVMNPNFLQAFLIDFDTEQQVVVGHGTLLPNANPPMVKIACGFLGNFHVSADRIVALTRDHVTSLYTT